jgi:hypothetical protein
MADSTLGGVVDFLTRFGLFDVVLPFLLVFTIVFAVLEKTRIMGKDKDGNPKANLDAMIAFVMAFMFVAATKLVKALNIALPYVVIMLVVIICILLLVATFYTDKEFDFFENYEKMKGPILVVVIIGVLSAFVFAMGWMGYVINYVSTNWDSTVFASIFFGLLIVVMMYFIVRTPNDNSSSNSKPKMEKKS